MYHFSLIAKPVHHSKSPLMQNKALKELGVSGVYTRYELENKDDLRSKFLSLGLNGANVSLPYKTDALLQSDYQSNSSKAISSANTLVYKNNFLYAYNTDFLGFLASLGLLDSKTNFKNALILGAGGTTKALAYALKLKNIQTTIANKSSSRFKDFDVKCVLYDELDLNDKYDLIINATSASLDDLLPCDENLLKPLFEKAFYSYEVGYFKSPFLNLFKEIKKDEISNQKAFYQDGAYMLCYQGAFSLMYFLGLVSDDEQVFLQDENLRKKAFDIAKIMYNIAFL